MNLSTLLKIAIDFLLLQARGVTIVAAPADTDVVTALDLVLQVR